MSEVRTYDPSRVNIIVGGIPISGYADGTFVTIEPLSDQVTSQSGADGEVARAMGTDRRHSVVLTLQQTSSSNERLSTLAEIDVQTNGGGTFPILVMDLSGRTLFAASRAWIVRRPAAAFSKEIEEREWTINTGAPSTNIVGGNG